MFDKIIAQFAPHNCIVCGLEGSAVCELCIDVVSEPKISSCHLCNALTPDFKTCDTCRRKTKLTQAYIASYYGGYVKQLLWMLKYQRSRETVQPLAYLIDSALPRLDVDLITWVPSSTTRYRMRGYNPAELLARQLARSRDLQYCSTLGRIGQSRQVGTSREERKHQLRGSLYPLSGAVIAGKKILIVDDVITTGATLGECAAVLKNAGASNAISVVVAKH